MLRGFFVYANEVESGYLKFFQDFVFQLLLGLMRNGYCNDILKLIVTIFSYID